MSRPRIPKPTSPPTRYEVLWVDANYDTDHDGPIADYKSDLVACPHLGYLVKVRKDHIVLAGAADVEDGVVHARFLMTIPRVHIVQIHEVVRKEAARDGKDAPQRDAPAPARGGEGAEA